MEMSIGMASVILFGSLLLLLITGLPVAFALGGIATLATILLFGFNSTIGIYMTTWSIFNNQMLLAIPLFLLMASIMQHSGIADDAYDMFHKWMGGLNGGLAMGTVLICLIFAAITGTSGAATVSMGLIALPAMIKRGYNKRMAIGAIAAGGVIGIIIPPSIIMIIYALIAHVPISKMFLGGVIPGAIGAPLFCIYIAIKCWLNPKNGPALPADERASWKEKVISLRALILPVLLILGVLGSIWGGIATPTEAASIGALGAFICAAIYHRLTWQLVKSSMIQTMALTAMIFWIATGASVFSNLYTQMGARQIVESVVTGLNVSPWVIMFFMQISLFLLGTIMDDYAIIMLAGPIYIPIIVSLGFDELWFGVVLIVNLSIGYLTPPYGFNLFYLRSLTPFVKEQTGVEVTMGDIYRGVIPFIILKVINLIIVMVIPGTVTWIPNMIYGQ